MPGGSVNYVGYLSNVLNLTTAQVNFLTQNPSHKNQLYQYLSQNSGDVNKEICREHINKMMSDNNYLQFVNNHNNTGNHNLIWWLDTSWLENPNNFTLNIENNGYDELTDDEKILVAIYPVQAYYINRNVQPAFSMADSKMGTAGGLNDKKDAFRHAFFQAINTRDVPSRTFPAFQPGASIVLQFANAHESEVPLQLNLEKQMDLFNNAVGINYCVNCLTTSNSSIADAIVIKINTGELRYLKPLLTPAQDPNFWGTGGTNNLQTATHGISGSTQVIPTNQ